MVAGWYRRSPRHVPAPAAVREVVIEAGPAFGSHAHPTTAMCLAALTTLPPGPALDIGSGCGILAVAWARLGRGPVLAVDLDPAALDQTAHSAAASGVAAELAGRTVFANLPATAHRELLAQTVTPPRALVVSGIRAGAGAPILAAWRRHGLRLVRATRMRRFECLVLAGAP